MTGNISDWQLCQELSNIVQSIYLATIIKYCIEKAVKAMAKEALKTSQQSGWHF